MTHDSLPESASRAATLIGLGAIGLWSALALLTASAGRIPPFQLAAMTFAIGGGLGLVYAAARGRLAALLLKAQEREKPRRPTRPTLASKTRRLKEKSRRGAVKALRGKAAAD